MDHAVGTMQEIGRTTGKEQRGAERLAAIRLRDSINTHPEDQGVTTPAPISAATGLLVAAAVRLVRLLTRRQWRAVAERLGLSVSLEGLDPSAGTGETL